MESGSFSGVAPRTPLGSCDWGGCDEPGYGEAFSESHGWLPVCWKHYCAALTSGHRTRHYDPCLCGGLSERFPDSDRPCVCYSDRNPDCTCAVNPGGQDGVLVMHDCPVHAARESERAQRLSEGKEGSSSSVSSSSSGGERDA